MDFSDSISAGWLTFVDTATSYMLLPSLYFAPFVWVRFHLPWRSFWSALFVTWLFIMPLHASTWFSFVLFGTTWAAILAHVMIYFTVCRILSKTGFDNNCYHIDLISNLGIYPQSWIDTLYIEGGYWEDDSSDEADIPDEEQREEEEQDDEPDESEYDWPGGVWVDVGLFLATCVSLGTAIAGLAVFFLPIFTGP